MEAHLLLPCAFADTLKGQEFGKPLPSFKWLIENGKVCALNFPIAMNAGLAKALGVMMKLDFERAVLNRVPQMARLNWGLKLNKGLEVEHADKC